MWCCWFSTLVQQALNNSVVPLLLMNNVLSLEFEPVKTCIASLNFLPGTTPAVRQLLAWLPEIAQESQNLLLWHLSTNSWAPWLIFLTTIEQPRQYLHHTSYHSPGKPLVNGNGQLRVRYFAHDVRTGFHHVYPVQLQIMKSYGFLPSHYASKDPAWILHTNWFILLLPEAYYEYIEQSTQLPWP